MSADWIVPLAVALLLAGSAFLSGSESALTGASRPRLALRARRGDRRAGRAARLVEERDRVVGAILLGNNLFNTAAAALATGWLASRLGGGRGILAATLAMTALVSVFGEILPKLYALQQPERNLGRAARALRLLEAAARPAVAAAHAGARRALAPAVRAGERARAEAEDEELLGAIEAFADGGEERSMLRSITGLDEVSVEDVMVHRSEVRSVEEGLAGEALLAAALAARRSRLPVWRGSPENVVGILRVKDLLRARAGKGWEAAAPTAGSLARGPRFARASTDLASQLRAFLREPGGHLAVVVGEHGETRGVVALEDVLEEIVGDIRDEEEQEEDAGGDEVREDPRTGAVSAPGGASTRDLDRRFGWTLSEGGAPTLAALVLEAARRIPEEGEELEAAGFRVRVLERRGRRLARLELRPPPPGGGDAEG